MWLVRIVVEHSSLILLLFEVEGLDALRLRVVNPLLRLQSFGQGIVYNSLLDVHIVFTVLVRGALVDCDDEVEVLPAKVHRVHVEAPIGLELANFEEAFSNCLIAALLHLLFGLGSPTAPSIDI